MFNLISLLASYSIIAACLDPSFDMWITLGIVVVSLAIWFPATIAAALLTWWSIKRASSDRPLYGPIRLIAGILTFTSLSEVPAVWPFFWRWTLFPLACPPVFLHATFSNKYIEWFFPLCVPSFRSEYLLDTCIAVVSFFLLFTVTVRFRLLKGRESLLSLFFPGLGQALVGRPGNWAFLFGGALFAWVFVGVIEGFFRAFLPILLFCPGILSAGLLVRKESNF